ncbi:hypothetical protein BBK14_11310 [Parafrankia soli]|uniref:Uncharacterized protein n=1 Tax=Parafrankia soli TaxID=2599596 RepID=A0A1S1RAB3_9ACTN|nr:hypothetical protein BBK14_11310 [Parafrankia soli]
MLTAQTIAELRARVAELEEQLGGRAADQAWLTRTQEAARELLARRADAADTQLAAALDRLDRTRGELTATQRDQATATARITDLRAAATAAHQRADAAEKRVAELEAQVRELIATGAELKPFDQEIQECVDRADARAHAAEKRVAELEGENVAVDEGRPEALDALLSAVAANLPEETPEERADWAVRAYRRAHRVAVRATGRVDELKARADAAETQVAAVRALLDGQPCHCQAPAQFGHKAECLRIRIHVHVIRRALDAAGTPARTPAMLLDHDHVASGVARTAADTVISALRDILARLRKAADATEPGMASGILTAVEWVTEALAQADVYLDTAGTPAETTSPNEPPVT